jgi:RNA polymerase sigma-70 factor (ECF subfamily)
LYREHWHALYRYCLSVCQDPELAQDCCQEAFLKAWKSLPRFRGDSTFATWLRTIAHNVMCSSFRKNRFWGLEDPLSHIVPAEEVHQPDLARDLDRAIAVLPAGARKVFHLYAHWGFAHKEIAERLGIAEGTSKAQFHRARQILSQALA